MARTMQWDPATEIQVRQYAEALGLDEEAVGLALQHCFPEGDVPADDTTVAANRLLSMLRHPTARRPLTVG